MILGEILPAYSAITPLGPWSWHVGAADPFVYWKLEETMVLQCLSVFLAFGDTGTLGLTH
jgi:hypothetical protein